MAEAPKEHRADTDCGLRIASTSDPEVFYAAWIINQQETGIDLRLLHDRWSPVEYQDYQGRDRKGGYYTPGEGIVLFNGQPYQFEVSEIDLGQDLANEHEARFPTSKRIITEVAPDLYDEEHDCVVVLFPGWAESTACFEGAFLQNELASLKAAGYKNPKILGINPIGKGTGEYMEERHLISLVRLKDELADSVKIVEYLVDNGMINEGRIFIAGHSMGWLSAAEAYKWLQSQRDIDGIRGNTAKRANDLVGLMPATGEMGNGLFDRQFLWTTRSLVPEFMQTSFGNYNGVALGNAFYAKVMADPEHLNDPSLNRGGVPDSSRKFFDYLLRFKEALPFKMTEQFRAAALNVWLYGGGQDKLFGTRIVDDLALRYFYRGISCPLLHVDSGSPHSFAFEHEHPERSVNLQEFLRKVFAEQR